MTRSNAQNEYDKKLYNAGFTLVEMLVTCVILGILLGASVRGLLGWQDWSRYNKENEYAETLFVAAQNRLSEYSSDGTLSRFNQNLKSNDSYSYVVDISSSNKNTRVIDTNGGQYTLTGVWEASQSEDAAHAALYQGDICYLMANQGDYVIYQEGGQPSGQGARLLFELLDDYVYDKSILNESICVEFSPESAQVFSVSYSDNAASFEYNNENENITGVLNVADRTESFRRPRFIGYYGVDTLTLATASSRKKPKLTDVKLNNEETLNLSFYVKKYPAANQLMTYEVMMYDAETDETLLKLYLDGKKLRTRTKDDGNVVNCPVTVYTTDETGVLTEKTDDYDMLAWIEEDGQVRLVFDAVDLQASSELYRSGADFAQTYSLHRFGVNAAKVKCSVQGSSDEYKTTKKVKTKDECSPYFADSGSMYDYDISNARHLYNVRYEDDESPEINYRLTADVDWEEFTSGMNIYNSSPSGITVNYTDADGNFPSFRKLRAGDSFDGQGYTISGISMSDTFNALSGVYGYTGDTGLTLGAELAGLSRNSSADENSGYVGLFCENDGDIKNLKLDNVTASGSDRVGIIAGLNLGTISECECSGDVTSTGGYAGGVAGVSGFLTENQADPEVLIKNCTYNGNLTASGSANEIVRVGGIAGLNLYGSTIEGCRLGALTDEEQEGGTFINVYNKASAVKDYAGTDGMADRYDGKIYDYSSSYGYIGGIAGENCGVVRSCDNYDADNALDVRIYAGAGRVGGIVGYNRNTGVVTGTVDAPVSTGNWDILCHAYEDGSGFGGIVGYTESGEDILFAYNHASISVTGDYSQNDIAAGGIAGRIENVTTTDMRIEHCVNYADISGAAENALTGYDSGSFGYACSKNVVCGGIVSMVKTRGIVINDCENYGNIGTVEADQTPVGDYTGGILAAELQNDSDEIVIENCTNYGNIYTTTCGGGIMADTDNGNHARGTEVYISNCVNAGSIYARDGSRYTGGIIGRTGKGESVRTSLYSTRNYGTAGRSTVNGLAGSSDADNAKLKSVANSLDVSGTAMPDDYPETDYDNVAIRDAYYRNHNYYINSVSLDLKTEDGEDAYDSAKSTMLAVVRSGEGDIYDIEAGGNKIITGLNVNPSAESYYSDTSDYAASAASGDKNSRINVYKELDPKYMGYIYDSYNTGYKLQSPENVSLNTDLSNYHFSWDSVNDAYAYEVRYVILNNENDADSDAFYTSVWYEKNADTGEYAETGSYIVAGRIFFEIPAKAEWMGKYIRFYVRAVNGQYMKDDTQTQYISDESVYTAVTIAPSQDYDLEKFGTADDAHENQDKENQDENDTDNESQPDSNPESVKPEDTSSYEEETAEPDTENVTTEEQPEYAPDNESDNQTAADDATGDLSEVIIDIYEDSNTDNDADTGGADEVNDSAVNATSDMYYEESGAALVRRTVEYSPVKPAEFYIIGITDMEENTYSFCLQKKAEADSGEASGAEYDVFVMDGEALEDSPKCTVSGCEDYAYAGTVTSDGTVVDISTYSADIDSVLSGAVITAGVRLEDGKICILLPDVKGVYTDEDTVDTERSKALTLSVSIKK